MSKGPPDPFDEPRRCHGHGDGTCCHDGARAAAAGKRPGKADALSPFLWLALLALILVLGWLTATATRPPF